MSRVSSATWPAMRCACAALFLAMLLRQSRPRPAPTWLRHDVSRPATSVGAVPEPLEACPNMAAPR
eukprot:4603892-Alexandrium_andersonii.AAC.1